MTPESLPTLTIPKKALRMGASAVLASVVQGRDQTNPPLRIDAERVKQDGGAVGSRPLQMGRDLEQVYTAASRRTYPTGPDEWTPEREARFNELLLKYVDQSLSKSEEREMERLQELRRTEAAPPTYEEVVLQMQTDEIIRSTIGALDRLIEHARQVAIRRG